MDLQRAWLQRGALAGLLWPLSLVYGALTAVRRTLYRVGVLETWRAGAPVIVVGNVIAGGSGKTPVVMAVVDHLQARGLKVGVVSRGYGRATDDRREVRADSDPREVGDEPALIHRATGAPVFVARRRIEAARALLARHPGTQCIVSDDGLQHLALGTRHRDLRLRRPRHRQRLAAAGRPAARAAGRGAATWCSTPARAPPSPASPHSARWPMQPCGRTAPPVPLASLAGRPLIAVAGIAKPEAFFQMLRERGLAPQQCIALPDHYDFTDWQPPPGTGYVLLCTEKDALKLWRRAPDALARAAGASNPSRPSSRALDAKLSSLDGHQAA